MSKKTFRHTTIGHAMIFRDSVEIYFDHGSHSGIIISSYVDYDNYNDSSEYYTFFGNKKVDYCCIDQLIDNLSNYLPENPIIELRLNRIFFTKNGEEELFWKWFINQNTIKTCSNFAILK